MRQNMCYNNTGIKYKSMEAVQLSERKAEITETLTEIAKPGALMGIVVALAEVVKQLGVPVRFIPLADIVIGVAVSFLVNYKTQGVTKSILIGVALGLSGCGAFSGVKNLFE